MMTAAMLEAAHQGRLDVLYLLGGNFLETMPDPDWCREALGRVPLRIHQDIVLNARRMVRAGGCAHVRVRKSASGASFIAQTKRCNRGLRPYTGCGSEAWDLGR